MKREPGSDTGLPRIDRISTRHLPPRQRFDYWRSLNFLVDLDLPDRDGLGNYRADLVRFLSPDGVEFGSGGSDDTIARFSKPCGDFVMLSMATSGKVRLAQPGSEDRVITPASGVSVVDGTRPLSTITSGHSHLYLALPRALVVQNLDDGGSLLDKGFLALAPSGLAQLLEAHLQAMAAMGEALDADTAKIAMKVAADLALGALAQASRPGGTLDAGRHADALFAAACRYISVNIGNPHLTARAVAEAVGCSRSQLFRVFESNGQTIGDVVEARRFRQASAMLAADAAKPIEQIAASCGFSSGATFARAFRRHFGMSPTAFRQVRLVS